MGDGIGYSDNLTHLPRTFALKARFVADFFRVFLFQSGRTYQENTEMQVLNKII